MALAPHLQAVVVPGFDDDHKLDRSARQDGYAIPHKNRQQRSLFLRSGEG